MESLDKEIKELKEFIADLKADRASEKDKQKRESWTKYTSITIVFLAVLTAIATQWAGKYSTRSLTALNEATFLQAKASDKWSYYQAKSIKQNLYEVNRDSIRMEPLDNPIPDLATKKAEDSLTEKKLADFGARISRYEAEKQQIKAEAEEFEREKEAMRKAAKIASTNGTRMGFSVSLYQIAIALSSVCLVTKRRNFWYGSICISLIAFGEMLWVWFQ